jgi:glycerol-3-phosphate acyltransferase PlsY
MSLSLTSNYSIIALIVGYLFGSIPFGLLLTKLFGLGDIRNIGSGNIGATNVLRTGNKGLAAATLAFDLLKATVPMLYFAATAGEEARLLAGFGAILGHMFPVWLGFRGGKGVATFIGVLLGIDWRLALAFGAIWLATALLFRFSSLAALVATAAMPLIGAVRGDQRLVALVIAIGALVFFRHRDNIRRLLRGEESRIGGDKKGS